MSTVNSKSAYKGGDAVVDFFILALVLTIGSVRYKCAPFGREIYSEGFSKNNTMAMRGILALLIIVYHFFLEDLNKPAFLELKPLGNSVVSVFFFLSGYALVWSCMHREDYMKGFLIGRIKSVVMPCIAYLALYTAVAYVFLSITAKDVLISIIEFRPVSHLWYIFVILFLYILFYVCFRRVNFSNTRAVRRASWLLTGCTIAYILIAAITQFAGYVWYISCIFFAIGVLFCVYRNKVEAVLLRHYTWFLTGSIACAISSWIFTFMVHHFTQVRIWLFLKIAVEICFVLFCVLMLEKVSFVNRITAFLGKISLELYMCHGLIIEIMIGDVGGYILWLAKGIICLLVFVLSMLLAWVLHMAFNFLFYKNRDKKGAK